MSRMTLLRLIRACPTPRWARPRACWAWTSSPCAKDAATAPCWSTARPAETSARPSAIREQAGTAEATSPAVRSGGIADRTSRRHAEMHQLLGDSRGQAAIAAGLGLPRQHRSPVRPRRRSAQAPRLRLSLPGKAGILHDYEFYLRERWRLRLHQRDDAVAGDPGQRLPRWLLRRPGSPRPVSAETPACPPRNRSGVWDDAADRGIHDPWRTCSSVRPMFVHIVRS